MRYKEALSRAIKAELANQGKSLNDLAFMVGCSPSSLSTSLKGSNMGIARLVEICDALNKPPGELMQAADKIQGREAKANKES